ncbi:MAG TPA: hypothetical protein VES89_09680, partial [Candidatus Competibacteraceae bacterium]|nr:hypothetical protein [Candidatus Competibacteraceae bacterium]
LQRWHPAWLEWLRRFWIGQILLGTTFAGSDFPDYVIDAWLPGWGRRHVPLLPDLYFPFSKATPITVSRSRVKPLKKLKRRIPTAG